MRHTCGKERGAELYQQKGLYPFMEGLISEGRNPTTIANILKLLGRGGGE